MLTWPRNEAFDEVASYPVWDPITITLIDADGLVVESGQDAALHVTLSGISTDDGHTLCISDYLQYTGALAGRAKAISFASQGWT